MSQNKYETYFRLAKQANKLNIQRLKICLAFFEISNKTKYFEYKPLHHSLRHDSYELIILNILGFLPQTS